MTVAAEDDPRPAEREVSTARMHYAGGQRLFTVDASDLSLAAFPRRLNVKSHRTGIVTPFDFVREMYDGEVMAGVEYRSQDEYTLHVHND